MTSGVAVVGEPVVNVVFEIVLPVDQAVGGLCVGSTCSKKGVSW